MVGIHFHQELYKHGEPARLTPTESSNDNTLQTYCQNNSQQDPVTLIWQWKRRTGSKKSKSWRKSAVPRSVAVLLNYIRPFDGNFTALVRVQPEHAGRSFARERSKMKRQLSETADLDRTKTLLHAWAKRFAVGGVTQGYEREACLSAGTECFAAYLTNYDFSRISFPNIRLLLAQLQAQLQAGFLAIPQHAGIMNLAQQQY